MASDLNERVSVALTTEKKEEWEQYVEENGEATNLSHLIRIAVDGRYGGRDGGLADVGGGLTDADRTTINEIANGVSALQSTVKSLDERLSAVEQDAQRQSELTTLKDKTFRALPTVEPGTDEWHDVETWITDVPDSRYLFEQVDADDIEEYWPEDMERETLEKYQKAPQLTTSGKVGEIAELLDESSLWVRAAAEELLEEPHVHRTTVDGKRYYWRSQ